MPNPIPTAIGRVQPIFKGPYESNVSYNKLDNVYYEGCTWVCLNNGVSTAPIEGSSWHKVASKGDTGGIGIPTATASPSDTAGVSVTVDSTHPEAAVFNFHFDLPKGDTGLTGIAIASASATPIGSLQDPTVDVTYYSATRSIFFQFEIPSASGEGIAVIDGDVYSVGASKNANLTAVRYGTVQSLTSLQQETARQNINAQITGNYPVMSDTTPAVDDILQFNGVNWVSKSTGLAIGESSANIGKYLYLGADTNPLHFGDPKLQWMNVRQVPAGGAAGQPLVKRTSADYDITWAATISSGEIDTLFTN